MSLDLKWTVCHSHLFPYYLLSHYYNPGIVQGAICASLCLIINNIYYCNCFELGKGWLENLQVIIYERKWRRIQKGVCLSCSYYCLPLSWSDFFFFLHSLISTLRKRKLHLDYILRKITQNQQKQKKETWEIPQLILQNL
jgi:hypothetical protein